MEFKKNSEYMVQMVDGVIMQRDRQADLSETGRSQSQNFNSHYYEEYKRLYMTAYYLSIQMKHLINAKQELWAKVGKLEKKTEEFKDNIRGQPPEKKKRFRRTAEEIQRKYICEVEVCQKCYGSEGSLQQHIKLKHPQLYQQNSHINSKSHQQYQSVDPNS